MLFGLGFFYKLFLPLRCTGFESKIENCRSKTGYEATRCTHAGDVAVECRVPGEPPHDYINKVRCILLCSSKCYVAWPRGAMPLRISDFHFPLSNFHFPLSNFNFPISNLESGQYLQAGYIANR